MGLLGKGILAIWNDIVPGGAAEFDDWHTREHVPERMGVPGFLRGRRYRLLSGRRAYFTLYETESVDVLASAAYLARLNAPTDWTRRALPLFQNVNRTACTVRLSLGAGEGGTLATVRAEPTRGADAEAVRRSLLETALPRLARLPGIVGAHFAEADLSATRVPTEERRLRAQEDELAAWVILVEGTEPEPVEAAARSLLRGGNGLPRAETLIDGALDVYRLLFSLAGSKG